jgi:hypothetical protein
MSVRHEHTTGLSQGPQAHSCSAGTAQYFPAALIIYRETYLHSINLQRYISTKYFSDIAPASTTPAKHRKRSFLDLPTGTRKSCLKKKTRGEKSRGTVPLNQSDTPCKAAGLARYIRALQAMKQGVYVCLLTAGSV